MNKYACEEMKVTAVDNMTMTYPERCLAFLKPDDKAGIQKRFCCEPLRARLSGQLLCVLFVAHAR